MGHMKEWFSILMMEIKLVAVWGMAGGCRYGLTRRQYLDMTRRVMRRLWQTKNPGFYHQGKAMLEVEAADVSNRLVLSADPSDPVLIVTVKNDLLRMRLLFEHYRALGVHQFVVLDNGSSDGTREFCAEQPDTLVIGIGNAYLTVRKEGWVEYAMRRIGTERWYIVVDSDELLDYPGSEEHTVRQLIRAQEKLGNERLCGYMLDMYDDQPLYATNCGFREIPRRFCWFDTDTYAWDQVLYGVRIICGGPRGRLLGRQIWSGKTPVFRFTKDMTNLNAHFQYPFEEPRESSVCVVLRHYKYLRSDKAAYRERAEERGGYGATAEAYAAINELNGRDGSATLWYAESARYESSWSLMKLPYLYGTFEA